MQKKRMNFKQVRRRRKINRWLRNYGNYAAAAVVFAVVLSVIIGVAAAMTNRTQKTSAQTQQPTESTTTTAGVATVLDGYQSDYESMIYSYDWDADDAEMLLKIAMAEAESESTEGKAMVMLVVLNRTWSKDFPNSIEEVIFQDTPSRQFAVTVEGGRYWTTTPDDDCRAALQLIESGWDKSNGAMYFESCKSDTSWHSRHLQFLFQLGNHKFYK